MFDVIIIGAGVIGCSVARELSKYNLKTCVLERCSDVSEGTSKANSAIIHAGYDAEPGTLKAKLNVKGNSMFDKLSKELDFPFKRNGSMVLCFSKDDMGKLNELAERGRKNGVPDIKVFDGSKVREMEPNISDKVCGALYAPTGAIVCPYEYTIALAENACTNGVQFKFDCEVNDIKKSDKCFVIKTSDGETYEAKVIINAAGVFADNLNNMVSGKTIKITPRKGEYCVFDKTAGSMVKRTLFQLPTKMGKGVLVTPTVDGNLLVGPNAVDIDDKDDVATTQEGLDDILNKASITIKEVPRRQIITSFSGLRAHPSDDDFIIGESKDAENFINVAGIESPGLSSSPAIAEMVEDIVIEKLKPGKNDKFNPIRKGIPKFREMNSEERQKLIEKDPAYGRVICRCETVTEGEILNSIRRPLGARSLDGVKKRTRAGMGRCQSGFCSTKVAEILMHELNLSYKDVTKFGKKSNLLVGKDKEI